MSKQNALNELIEIRDQLSELEMKANKIFEEYFPEVAILSNAYGCTQFGYSYNHYDTSFESILEQLTKEQTDESSS